MDKADRIIKINEAINSLYLKEGIGDWYDSLITKTSELFGVGNAEAKMAELGLDKGMSKGMWKNMTPEQKAEWAKSGTTTFASGQKTGTDTGETTKELDKTISSVENAETGTQIAATALGTIATAGAAGVAAKGLQVAGRGVQAAGAGGRIGNLVNLAKSGAGRVMSTVGRVFGRGGTNTAGNLAKGGEKMIELAPRTGGKITHTFGNVASKPGFLGRIGNFLGRGGSNVAGNAPRVGKLGKIMRAVDFASDLNSLFGGSGGGGNNGQNGQMGNNTKGIGQVVSGDQQYGSGPNSTEEAGTSDEERKASQVAAAIARQQGSKSAFA